MRRNFGTTYQTLLLSVCVPEPADVRPWQKQPRLEVVRKVNHGKMSVFGCIGVVILSTCNACFVEGVQRFDSCVRGVFGTANAPRGWSGYTVLACKPL